jgi:DNA ligase-1
MATFNPSPIKYTKIHHEFLPIFGLDKNGRMRIWHASVYSSADEQTGMYVVQHGLCEGKLQIDTREFMEGKNIGKRNATTGLEQCMQEITKKRKDKMEKEGYSETKPVFNPENADTPGVHRKVFPMLANKYEPTSTKKHGIQYPCFVQPKLDGLRCVVYRNSGDGSVVYQSRTGGIFTTLGHLTPHLLPLFEKNSVLILDGELYTDRIPFEELAGIIKKKTLSAADTERIKSVEYHAYDIIMRDMPYSERLKILQSTLAGAEEQSPVKFVPTYIVQGIPEFRERFSQFVADGYEGIMLRNQNGHYIENYRSNDLQKYKEFCDAEYPIIGFKEGIGRDAGTVIWLCVTPEGREFNVRPKGSLEFRRNLFQNATKYLGAQLTVIYQELSEMGVPRFPVGKTILQ